MTVTVDGTHTSLTTASVVTEPLASVTVMKLVIVDVVVGPEVMVEVKVETGVVTADPLIVTVLYSVITEVTAASELVAAAAALAAATSAEATAPVADAARVRVVEANVMVT